MPNFISCENIVRIEEDFLVLCEAFDPLNANSDNILINIPIWSIAALAEQKISEDSKFVVLHCTHASYEIYQYLSFDKVEKIKELICRFKPLVN